MDYNSPENLEACFKIVEQASKLLYYSHIPTSILAVLIGCFVLFKNKASLVSKILFALSLSFALWTTINLTVWLNYDKSTLLMFAWSFFGVAYSLIYIFSLYLVYVFIDKKDISLKLKIIFGTLLLPTILLTPTKYNLEYYNTVDCIAADGKYFSNYYYLFGLFIFLWIIVIAFLRYRKAEKESKKQILLLTIGIELFLFVFFSIGFLFNYLINNGYIAGGDYGMEQYGLFGMPVFLGFLAYLIVKFKAFDIKMLAAEALVVGLVILLFSEFFFIGIENTTVTILISVTIILATLFGIWLINSVKKEEQRKEELQLMSGKLSEANDQLRRLDNSKSEFISIASHQLRTPLTAIKGFVSLLLEGSYGKVDPKQGDVLNKVYASNERMVNLVEDLLNVSRMESGRMEFKFMPCKVDDICQEVVDTFFPKAKNLGLYLDYKKPETTLPEVMIDGTKVREVISNLVDNALKYTPKGGVSIRVEQFPISNFQFPNNDQESNIQKLETKNQGPVIRVTVSDTGIGVPATELPYLFAKFSRGKDISRLNTGGTGLGLFVGKSMIEQNGGKIWAESEGVNKGSKFIIEIPIQQSKELMERWG